MEIRQITLDRFRRFRHFVWHPQPGINCLIGPGDGGKTTQVKLTPADQLQAGLVARDGVSTALHPRRHFEILHPLVGPVARYLRIVRDEELCKRVDYEIEQFFGFF